MSPSPQKAPWISVEGVDGAGKSSHIAAIADLLTAAGFDVVSTREPGGTPLGEKLRIEILTTPMALQTEVLLAFASRAEHLDQVIRPAQSSGQAVVCDRFTDSTYAYQGRGQGHPVENIKALEAMVHPEEQPHLTLLFDLPVEESLKRLGGTGKTPDKFESQPADYFERVRQGYLERARAYPARIKVIDSQPAWADVHANVLETVKVFIDDWARKHSLSQEPRHRLPKGP